MLLTRLELRNFLAYRAPAPLVFDGIGLAVLSGVNGAGKTSLLDAVTWALWGTARARTDDELIHVGQKDMSVTVDFMQDGRAFRVIRKRVRGGKASLDLFADDPAFGWRSVNEGSIRETQTRIIHLLHLDYETFVNSAFLQQGKADSFTLKTPSERKKILAEILGLNRWADYEVAAKAEITRLLAAQLVLRTQIQFYESDEKNEPQLLLDLDAVRTREVAVHEARLAAEERYEAVNGSADKLRGAREALAAFEAAVKSKEGDLKTVNEEIDRQGRDYDTCARLIGERDSIDQGYAELEQARQLADELTDRLQQSREAERQASELARLIDAERAGLENSAARWRDRLTQAERIAMQGEQAAHELSAIEDQMAAFEVRRQERERVSGEIAKLSGERNGLTTVNEALRVEMDDIQNRLVVLRSGNGDAMCPVCRQPLDDAHKDDLVLHFQDDGKVRGDQFRAQKGRIKAIEGQIKEHESTLRTLDIELRRLDMLKMQAGEIANALANAQASAAQAQEAAAELGAIEAILNMENYGGELRAQLAAIHNEIAALGYDAGIHSQTQRSLKQLNAFATRKQALETAIARLPELEATLATAYERRDRWSAERDAARLSAEEMRALIEALKARATEEKLRKDEVAARRLDEARAIEDRISIDQKLKSIDDGRVHRDELEQKWSIDEERRIIHEQLREAFGKNGVPAMIIEAAIPELENAANQLLSRITDGRMHVRMDTQREKKTGGQAETLDILISDELGTRDYSLYSGGEGFRVNFAVRVALSQFLAKRAGAQLRTLFIDEGFGSQDTEGRERLLEAINAISGQFELILVVTHIDELREAFPVHIRVSKGSDGSTIDVL